MAGESTADQNLGGVVGKEGLSTTWGEQCLADFGYTKQQLAERGFKCEDVRVGETSYGKAYSLEQPDSKSSPFGGIARSIVAHENRVTLTASRYKKIPKVTQEGPSDEELRPEQVEFTVFNPRLSTKKRAQLVISSLSARNQRSEAKITVDQEGYVNIEQLLSDRANSITPIRLPIIKENIRLILQERLGFTNEQLRLMDVDRVTRIFLKLVTEGSFAEGAIFDPQLLEARGKPGQVVEKEPLKARP